MDSAYFLTVNGKEIGYATGAHCTHEFDLTDALQEGVNKIRMTVFKWCSSSYVEDQDKYRLSGIFRDAYILRRPEGHLTDYKITTDYEGTVGKIFVELDKRAEVCVYDGEELISKQSGEKLCFEIPSVKLWTAETPNLYKLTIDCQGEKIVDFAGVRKITIDGRVYKINGKPVKIKGVNRHSFTVDGYVETLEDIEKDLKILREHNVNAIRTSHYMPHAYLPKLCDKYGLYLMIEMDMEIHGSVISQGCWVREHWARIPNDKNFLDIFMMRAETMYERDKNRPSVVFWSMGNESGWGENFLAVSKYLHDNDNRPVHYEGTCHATDDPYDFDVAGVDVYSRMYYSIPDIEHAMQSEELKVPFIQCEYSHAMGNSCGDMNEYWQCYYAHEEIIGGFIWEYCDESVITKDGKFFYGGDMGEYPHSGNFCVDGLVDADRKFIHSAFKEAKQCYAPVDLRYENGVTYIKNRYDFVSLDGISCNARIEINGETVKEFTLDLTGIAAREEKAFELDYSEFVKEYATVNFVFTKDGFEIAVRQIILSDCYPVEIPQGNQACKSVKLSQAEDGAVEITTDKAAYSVNAQGMISSVKTNKEYLLSPMNLQILRAQIDNDIGLNRWVAVDHSPLIKCLKESRFFARKITVENNTVRVQGKFAMCSLEWRLDTEIVYSFFDGGRVSVSVNAKQHLGGQKDVLTRFGFELPLAGEMANVKYFGRGTEECYEDKKLLATVGMYESKVTDMYVRYVKPQESGGHCDTRMVNVFGADGGVKAISSKNFSFTLAPQRVKDYPLHRHDEVLPPRLCSILITE